MSSPAGSWKPLDEITPDGKSLISMEVANKLIRAVNALGCLMINPTANVATFSMTTSRATLDLSQLDARLSLLEANLGISAGGDPVTNSNSTIITQVNILSAQINTLTNQVNTINNRLGAANATANCVGNAVQITFNI